MSPRQICLITAGDLSSDPRIVKEADALHEAGYSVRVIALDPTGTIRNLNNSVLRRVKWRVDSVQDGPRAIHLMRRLRQEVFKKGVASGLLNKSQSARALSPLTERLAEMATAERADLYIGHCLATLPAVALAARAHRAKCGFDAEDDHVGELEDNDTNKAEVCIRKSVEEQFLPQCSHLTAAAPGIAESYRERYNVDMTPILNVFPLALSPPAPSKRHKKTNRPLSLYWFSQTIGPGRGLEEIICGMRKVEAPVTLAIRGHDFLGYSAHLRRIARAMGVESSITFFPSAPPDDLAKLASEYDVGLATELETPPNHSICLSNKIFTYLLGGTAVLLSNTPAQAKLAPQLGAAAQVVNLARPDSVAEAIEFWAHDTQALRDAKEHAWQLGQTRFNWDFEKKTFLRLVEQVLS